jgi:hypothetical protein
MINIKTYFLVITSFLFLASCSMLPESVRGSLKIRHMSDVVRDCESFKVFSDMASCIKETYSKEGNAPNDVSVRAFYSMIDAINEKYQMKNVTEAEARSSTYKALLETVEASNQSDANRAAARAPYVPNKTTTCNKIGNTVTCY